MTSRFLICIPVYNNPNTIIEVIQACMAETDLPILVVDDGSDISIEDLFRHLTPVGQSRVTFLRHSVNQGKGVALQTAFKYAISGGYTHAVAIDGDGQHLPAEINKLVQGSKENPWALIVGDRNMQTANVPGSSLFGKKFSNFWVRYQTNVGVADSQSGFRIYPLFYIQNMRFFCKKYDFEIEVLIRLIWKGVQVKNVGVSVLYFPQEKRVSHFHKLRDNYRITVLNTFLTTASVVWEQASPFKSSLGFAIGVFVGTIPIYGLHTGIALVLAFAFRLNFVYLWVGTNISIPPFIPFILIASRRIGEQIGHRSAQSISEVGTSVAIGSVILGLFLGLVAFVLMYGFKKAMLRKKSEKAWTGKTRNETGVAIVRFILKLVGLRATYFCLYFIAFYYFLFSFRTRKSFAEYWKIIRPELGWLRRQGKMYQQVLVFAKTLVDRGFQKQSSQVFFKYDYDQASHEFAKHFKPGAQGAVVVASHIGGWELAMRFFSQVPSDKKILAVMHGIPGQDTHSSGPGDQNKSEVILYNLDQNSLLKIKNYLTEGQIVGMMGDRPVTDSFEMLPFFGKLACFDTTPIRMALACQVELYFVFSVKTGLCDYKVFTVKGRLTPGKSRAENTEELVRQYVQGLEDIVNQYPEQWFNFFPFWSENLQSKR